MIEWITKDVVHSILADHYRTATQTEENLIVRIWNDVKNVPADAIVQEGDPYMDWLLEECGFER